MNYLQFNEGVAFYNVADFYDMKEIQQNYLIIQKELSQNKIWLHWGSDDYDQSGHCKFLDGDWTVCPLYFGNYPSEGMEVKAQLTNEQRKELMASLPERFPASTELLKHFPRINFAGFSRLHPKSTLAPHRHYNPTSLIFHLGLIIPPGETCGIKVGEQTHIWREAGEAIIFNDNLIHSAWNNSDQERIILYIDFLRPINFLQGLGQS
ncbi:aspartyl/asparaginyl beta-hydroxylase domain-containing protein [Candidatus Protochlamydia phocaeensis]|uniref:aspartyl/asparaginyl beta-hydroxylase domain-containing protein n=1 Tax=Candidatus Protochlamydia phocaeensis TaxID=1414722 RepID=UPI0008384739|nr:aspartyl/asparaginyl beta-hydroxylase domain-containing protein [Candidatus Protochlamydia phocaeensis]